MFTYFLVMDAWNYVVARFDNEAEAKACARVKGGFVVPFRTRRG